MKEQFKRCMQILYPQGLNWEKDKAQHRALIKVFGMAWTETDGFDSHRIDFTYREL